MNRSFVQHGQAVKMRRYIKSTLSRLGQQVSNLLGGLCGYLKLSLSENSLRPQQLRSPNQRLSVQTPYTWDARTPGGMPYPPALNPHHKPTNRDHSGINPRTRNQFDCALSLARQH
jgi:hypothetical protein